MLHVAGRVCTSISQRCDPGAFCLHAATLAGVMDNKNAAKGVLVTTSWVGKASRDFAARNGNRIQIIEGREPKHLLREHLDLGIGALIGMPKLPPGWEQHDIT